VAGQAVHQLARAEVPDPHRTVPSLLPETARRPSALTATVIHHALVAG
jgi:hypothetical protein